VVDRNEVGLGISDDDEIASHVHVKVGHRAGAVQRIKKRESLPPGSLPRHASCSPSLSSARDSLGIRISNRGEAVAKIKRSRINLIFKFAALPENHTGPLGWLKWNKK